MPKPSAKTGEKNLIRKNLIELRKIHGLSQKGLSEQLQLRGCDVEKNVITRIETNKRFVTDLELKAIADFFQISCEELIRDNDTQEES